MIIAVDGASGTGKSTVCKLLASELGFLYIDTGAIYRSVALMAKRKDIELNDDVSLKELCRTLKLSFVFKDGINKVLVDGEDVSEQIRTPNIAMLASKVSSLPAVRDSLLEMQRVLAKSSKTGTVVDGRDMGTIVFPDADLKVFLTASDQVRAQRRYDELKNKKMNVSFEQILKETVQRDKQDSERTVAPLKKAKNAIEINTDHLTVAQVKDRILNLIL